MLSQSPNSKRGAYVTELSGDSYAGALTIYLIPLDKAFYSGTIDLKMCNYTSIHKTSEGLIKKLEKLKLYYVKVNLVFKECLHQKFSQDLFSKFFHKPLIYSLKNLLRLFDVWKS